MVLSGRSEMVGVIRVPLGEQPAGHPNAGRVPWMSHISLNVSSE